MLLLAAQSPGTAAPARGAPLSDLISLSIVFAVAGLVLLAVSIAHRRGRIAWLQRIADFSEETSGLPGWAALPQAIGDHPAQQLLARIEIVPEACQGGRCLRARIARPHLRASA